MMLLLQVLENCIIVILARVCIAPSAPLPCVQHHANYVQIFRIKLMVNNRYTLGKTFTKYSDVACDVFEEDIGNISSFFKMCASPEQPKLSNSKPQH